MSETSSVPTSTAPVQPNAETSAPTASLPFWKTTPLDKMTPEQWESLCDGCGKCCLHKLQDEDDDGTLGEIFYTSVACRLLDLHSCRCSRYAKRWDYVPDCVQLYPAYVGQVSWLPRTCAYLLIHQGKDLPDWHPLVNPDPEAIHRAGISVRGRAVPERKAGILEDYVVHWPDV